MANRLSTGLAGLDAQLGGGLIPGSIHVVIGEPMNAQELLSYHFAAAGSMRPGGSVFYTTDYTKAEVAAGLRMVGAKVEKVDIVDLPSGKTKWAVAEPRKGQTLVYDSFSQAIVQGSWKEALAQMTRLKAKVQANGDVALLAVTGNLHSDLERTMLKQLADGVIELGFDRQGFGLYPYMKITKMRGVPDSARFLLFKETERGLFMESTKRVF